MPRLTAIYLRPSSRTPVRSVERAQVQEGYGIDGDHAGGRGSRQVLQERPYDLESGVPDFSKVVRFEFNPASRSVLAGAKN